MGNENMAEENTGSGFSDDSPKNIQDGWAYQISEAVRLTNEKNVICAGGSHPEYLNDFYSHLMGLKSLIDMKINTADIEILNKEMEKCRIKIQNMKTHCRIGWSGTTIFSEGKVIYGILSHCLSLLMLELHKHGLLHYLTLSPKDNAKKSWSR